MSKIIVTRKQEWINRFRQIGIYVDGKKIDGIANGEIKTFEIPKGNHSIKAKIDWCGSREIKFSISPQEKKYFILSGFKHSNVFMLLGLILFIANFFLQMVFHIGFAVLFILPIFLIMIYYITFGRNDYLRLKQTETW